MMMARVRKKPETVVTEEFVEENKVPLTKTRKPRTVKPKPVLSELVEKGLIGIPNEFSLDDRRSSDNGLKRLFEEYEDCVSRNSTYPCLAELQTGMDIKIAISKMTFEEQITIVYGYLAGVGRVEEHLDYDKEVKKFRIRFIKWGVSIFFILFVAIVGGVVTAGIIRNDINSNEFLRMFMDLVNKITEIWFTGKQVIE